MTRDVITTPRAPQAIGPYVQGIRAGGFIFTAGQVGFDPTTGAFAADDVAGQTRQVLQNLQAILEAGGSSLAQVVKTTVFLVDMNDFATMNAIYAEFFGDNPPARSTVAAAALPRGAKVEIEAVALA